MFFLSEVVCNYFTILVHVRNKIICSPNIFHSFDIFYKHADEKKRDREKNKREPIIIIDYLYTRTRYLELRFTHFYIIPMERKT